MKKTVLSLVLVIVALVGLLDASYMTYETLTGQTPTCRPPFACAKVLESPWAKIAGVPLSVYGLGFYLSIFTMAILQFLEVHISIPVLGTTKKTMTVLTTFGFLFSLYLLTLMGVIIQGWCLYCLISAASCISLFLTQQLLNASTKHISD